MKVNNQPTTATKYTNQPKATSKAKPTSGQAAQTNQTNNTNTTAENTANRPASSFTRSNALTPEQMREVNRLIDESRDLTRMFEQLVSSVMNMQGRQFSVAFNNAARMGNLREMFEGLVVDEAAQARAAELVSEDGYFGVAQTAERLLSFARAFAGNDPERIEIMRTSFLKGFDLAARAWGGELPEISQQTRDAVLAGFDEMRAAATGTSVTVGA